MFKDLRTVIIIIFVLNYFYCSMVIVFSTFVVSCDRTYLPKHSLWKTNGWIKMDYHMWRHGVHLTWMAWELKIIISLSPSESNNVYCCMDSMLFLFYFEFSIEFLSLCSN